MSTELRVECYICRKAEEDDPEVEIRFYGPNGAPICFDCMKADPTREAEARRQFHAQLEAAEANSDVVLIGERTGPRPLGGSRDG